MPIHFTYRTIVEFADTDMAGIMHFAHFFRYMERAEHAFWRSLGLSVHMEIEGRTISWPRMHVSCDYRQPLRFEDEIDIELTVREIRPKAIIYDFQFRKGGSAEIAANGAITAVCVTYDTVNNRMKAVEIPPTILGKIEGVARNQPVAG
jgi:acyl-CoA thioester hydrolase